jgi:hypothetical protein
MNKNYAIKIDYYKYKILVSTIVKIDYIYIDVTNYVFIYE